VEKSLCYRQGEKETRIKEKGVFFMFGRGSLLYLFGQILLSKGGGEKGIVIPEGGGTHKLDGKSQNGGTLSNMGRTHLRGKGGRSRKGRD